MTTTWRMCSRLRRHPAGAPAHRTIIRPTANMTKAMNRTSGAAQAVLLIALMLFIVALVAAAGWYYWYYIKPAQVSTSQVPVVAAPEKPAKTEPEPVQPSGSTLGTSNGQGSLESSPERRKQNL